MRQLGSTIECYRGESFVVKRIFVNENGEPLYVKKDAKNPFIRFTISSNTYKINGEYKKNYWLELGPLRFSGYSQFEDNVIPDDLTSLSKDVIYYLITENGREYYVYDGDKLLSYAFYIVKRFLNSDTKHWVGQIYQYEITYCEGELMIDWLQKVFKSLYPGISPPSANSELAYYICKKRNDLLDGIDITEPFVSYTVNRVLQGPSKLIVKEN